MMDGRQFDGRTRVLAGVPDARRSWCWPPGSVGGLLATRGSRRVLAQVSGDKCKDKGDNCNNNNDCCNNLKCKNGKCKKNN